MTPIAFLEVPKELWRIGAVVAAGWGCLLAAFTLLLAGYGENPFVVVIYGAAVILCWIIAAALLLWSRRNAGKSLWRPIPSKIGSSALFAIAAGLVGLGVTFTWALYPAAFRIAVLGVRQWWGSPWRPSPRCSICPCSTSSRRGRARPAWR